MTVKTLISQLEHTDGRKSHKYLLQLINDCLDDMSGKIRHYSLIKKSDLVENQRWYELDDNVIDITRVEILDGDSDYILIPRLTDSHSILKEDTT